MTHPDCGRKPDNLEANLLVQMAATPIGGARGPASGQHAQQEQKFTLTLRPIIAMTTETVMILRHEDKLRY